MGSVGVTSRSTCEKVRSKWTVARWRMRCRQAGRWHGEHTLADGAVGSNAGWSAG